MKSLLLLLIALFPISLFAQTGKIIVKMDNFKSDSGQVRVYLFNSAEGFPSKPKKALAVQKVKIANKQSVAIFENLPYGMYAVGTHHDENNNDKMDSNWMHIPREGWGASNNAKGFLGTPPSFKGAKFELKADSVITQIKMRH